jgi:hypothetical protein
MISTASEMIDCPTCLSEWVKIFEIVDKRPVFFVRIETLGIYEQ